MSTRTFRFLRLVLMAGIVCLSLPVSAATINVDTTDDELNSDGDCSLREAIQTANTDAAVDNCTQGSGADIINVPAGTYTLSVAGEDEDSNATGDLDLNSSMSIVGAGMGATILDAGGVDRLFDIPYSATPHMIAITGVTMTGATTSAWGCALRAQYPSASVAELTLDAVRVTGNVCPGSWGPVNVQRGGLTIRNSVIDNNNVTPDGSGGGLYTEGAKVLVEDSSILANSAGYSGGISCSGDVTIRRSLIRGNVATNSIGGAYIFGSEVSPATVVNTTVSDNVAPFSAGLRLHGGNINHSTIANNIGDGFDGEATIKASIIAGNTTDVVSFWSTSQGYNIIGDASGDAQFTHATDLTSTDPLLAPLADNGGPTLTYALQNGSPAIDTGTCITVASGILTVDQRGEPRPFGPECDRGAFELGDNDGDGVPNSIDNCPDDNNPGQQDGDSDGIGDVCDPCIGPDNVDDDGDNLCNSVDNCPDDINPGQEDTDNDSIGDACDPCTDQDGDLVCDPTDNCILTSNPAPQTDSDGDGSGDECDLCFGNDAVGDVDGDGRCSDEDNCPFVANIGQVDSDGDGLGNACDMVDNNDADGDGVDNDADNCPFDANAAQADTDGDGVGDACDSADGLDVDGDGVGNAVDNCPFDANAAQADADGDGLGDACDSADGLDVDGDGVANAIDNCPFAANASQADADGDSLGDACDSSPNDPDPVDLDGDGVANDTDNCPFVTNAGQADADGDGAGDACDAADDLDLDGDGIANEMDNCAFDANATQADADGDGVGDACDSADGLDVDGDGVANDADNCAFEANADQADGDGDGLGDVCDGSAAADPDEDGDGVDNVDDNCPLVANADQADGDGDGLGNACDSSDDLDIDGDGVDNSGDNCPFDSNADQADADIDGLGDACDLQDLRDDGCSAAGNSPGTAWALLLLACLFCVLPRRRRRRRS